MKQNAAIYEFSNRFMRECEIANSVEDLEKSLAKIICWDNRMEIGLSLPSNTSMYKYAEEMLEWFKDQNVKDYKENASLLDILKDCIIADLVIEALHAFDVMARRSWLAEQNDVDNTVKDADYVPKQDIKKKDIRERATTEQYAQWLFHTENNQTVAKMKKIVNKIENSKRLRVSRYYFQDNHFRFRTLDKEFFQLLIVLSQFSSKSYGADGDILNPCCFLPLIHGHPLLIHSIEKNWDFYKILFPEENA